MDSAESVLAVVRTLPDATLAMSVLDGNRQYTLLPNNSAAAATVPLAAYMPVVPMQSVGTEPCTETRHGVQSHGAQAVDGRYASVYQMSHCNVQPTSPPVQLTEFPPQRAEWSRGQGHFEVGGIGSGETNVSPTRITQSYRGGLNWPDRSVYSPRQQYHYEPDSFADSLRKYPNMSPERSAEIVERLINYTQMKSSCLRHIGRNSMSPTRSEVGPGQGMERRSCVSASVRTSRYYEPENRPKVSEESPTRDTCKKIDYESIEMKRSMFGRNYDVRYLRDITRRAKESVKNISTYPYSHPVCPPIKERFDHLPPKNDVLSEIISISSVHMETQAEIPMVSKEVTTMPRERPSTRNVAVPLSPTSSQSDSAKLSDGPKPTESSSQLPEAALENKLSHKSIQTTNITDLALRPRKSAQTCISSIDIVNEKKVKTCRKSKSQEEIRTNDDFEEELLQVIKDLSVNFDVDTNFCVRNALLRKLRKIYRTERSDRLKIKLGRCMRDQLYSHMDVKNFTKELSNELISKIQASNMFLRCYGSTKVLRTDVIPTRNNSDKCVNELIKEWLDDIPVKRVDYLGRPVKKELVLQALASKVKCLIMNKIQHDRCGSLKPELLDILEDIPIEVSSRNKKCFLNKIAGDLVRKIKDLFSVNATDRKRGSKYIDLDKSLRNNFRKELFPYTYMLPTDNALKHFIKQELRDFTTKFHVIICPSTEKEIQIELIEILTDSLSTLRCGDDEIVKEEILVMLSEFINISENEGIYFVNNLVYNFKDLLKELHTDEVLPQTFVVLQNTMQNSSNQTVDNPTPVITDRDINSNLSVYTQQIVQHINEWIEDIRGISKLDAGLRKLVSEDLARDIVDRHKYLELNPRHIRSDADELEHLKYQIFKWGKIVEEDNLEIIEYAPQLMQRIQSISIPILTSPVVTVLNVDTSTNQPCCLKDSGSNPSEQRRTSSPGANSCPKPESKYEKTRISCPYAMAFESTRNDRSKCCSAEVATENLGVMTDPDQEQIKTEGCCKPINTPSTPLVVKTAYTETEMPQIPTTCPQGTSMSMTECPKSEHSANRRFSGPPGVSNYTNTQPAEQRAVPAPACNTDLQSNSRPHNTEKPRPLCCVVEPKDPSSIIKQLNDEYDHYLQNWVSQIPIITSKPEEQALIDTMRKGIYNGVWKARTKLQMNPNAMDNRFYYQDLLDDELEELLDLLPQSCELSNNKQMLKNQLIEKTTNINEQMHNSSISSSYKQQLIDNVGNHIPRKTLGLAGSDVAKICEDIHKLNLAETFIMYTMYRDKDSVKANVFKKKLMKQVQDFFDNLKRTHGIEAATVDFKTYKNEIMNALYTVPQPSDETIREEGDEVLIGLEIEQWFSDLPLYPADNNFEKLCRKRYRDTLAKRVHDLENKKNIAECEDELRHEITRFMGKLPLRDGELQNMPFMVEELVNRLKNRPKDLIVGSEKRRGMPLINPYDYDEFSRDMPLSSSFTDALGARRAQVNESSYLIRGGERISDQYCPSGQFGQAHHSGDTSDSNQQWVHDDGPLPGRQSGQRPNSNQQWKSLHDDGLPQPRQSCQGSDSSQQWQSLQNDGLPRTRQTCQGHDSNQQWQSLYDDGPPQAMHMGQRTETSPQSSADCCQLQNEGDVKNISIPRDRSYRELESQREGTLRREQSPDRSRLQETHLSGTFAGRNASPDQRSTGLSSPKNQDSCAGTCAGQANSPDQRSLRQGQEPGYSSRFQDMNDSGTCLKQGTSSDQRSLRQSQESCPYSSRQQPHISGTYARQTSDQEPENFPGDTNRSSFPRNPSPGFSLNVCPRAQENRRSMSNNPGTPFPSCGPEVSTKPYAGLCPGSSQGQSNSHQSPSCFSRQPVGSSTPQQDGPSPRVSRPKKRSRQIDKQNRDAAKKKLEISESDDSGSEEVKCRCMERIWRRRKKRPIYAPCDECDIEFPPCFPMGFPYPYYF